LIPAAIDLMPNHFAILSKAVVLSAMLDLALSINNTLSLTLFHILFKALIPL